MRTPKTPDKLGTSQFSKFLPEYVEYAERIQKTLYYGKLPTTDRPSLPFTSMSVEKFSKFCRQDGLEKLDLRYASSVCYEACITPCSLILALVYLERLRASNPEYLATAPPSQVFLIAVMVASKYLYDDGEEDEVFNDEWATSAALPLAELNKAEREFLVAIDWNLFVDADAFVAAFEQVEGDVAWREGQRRGYFTYSDLTTLSQILPGSCASVLNLISHMFAVCMVSYTAALITVVAGTLLAQECSQHITSAITEWTSHLATTANTSTTCSESTVTLSDQYSLAEALNALTDEVDDADEGNVSLAGVPSHAITTLTTSIILALSSPAPPHKAHHRYHQYLTKTDDEDDCLELDSSEQDGSCTSRRKKSITHYSQDDCVDFNPSDIRLTFTTGPYWPPSSQGKRFRQEGDNFPPVQLPNLDLHASDLSYDRKDDWTRSNLWMFSDIFIKDSAFYGSISNFSGIGAPNLCTGGMDGRAGGMVEWLSWVSQELKGMLGEIVSEPWESGLVPSPILSNHVAVAYS